jgi:hypothetical protein
MFVLFRKLKYRFARCRELQLDLLTSSDKDLISCDSFESVFSMCGIRILRYDGCGSAGGVGGFSSGISSSSSLFDV